MEPEHLTLSTAVSSLLVCAASVAAITLGLLGWMSDHEMVGAAFSGGGALLLFWSALRFAR